MTKTILLIGTLDTKGVEFAYVRNLIHDRGYKTLVMDAGVQGEPAFEPDLSAEAVAEAGSSTLQALRDANDRGAALITMADGVQKLTVELFRDHKIDGVLSLGGSGGTAVATPAMQRLPVGFPKVMVSTMAAGDVASYVGAKDVAMIYSVVDVAGLNSVSRRIFANGVGAVCGMLEQETPQVATKPIIAASMFGVTTPCVTRMRETFEQNGYEVLVFHATGSGGRSMEGLIEGGFVAGVADVTTTEWCDELVGGVLAAGEERLDAAAKAGIPQVVSVGALDMVNFGPKASVPTKFDQRNLYVHNASVTLMRTTPEECAELGKILAHKLNQSTGPTALFVPLHGVSMIDADGMPFYDPVADQKLFQAIRHHLNQNVVELHELEMHINDDAFADAMSERLLRMLIDSPTVREMT